jgi:hypothetical protein
MFAKFANGSSVETEPSGEPPRHADWKLSLQIIMGSLSRETEKKRGR